MNITFEFATTDDCLDKMVPSDLRKLVSERDTALQRLHVIEQAAKALLAELSQHQVCTSCGCGAEEPEAVALKAALTLTDREVYAMTDSVIIDGKIVTKQQVAGLIDKNAKLCKLLKAAESQSEQLTLLALGEITLADIQAEAGHAGFIAGGFAWGSTGHADIAESLANDYAERVKDGEK